MKDNSTRADRVFALLMAILVTGLGDVLIQSSGERDQVMNLSGVLVIPFTIIALPVLVLIFSYLIRLSRR